MRDEHIGQTKSAAQFLEKTDAQWKIAGPAAADLNAFLAKHWSPPAADEAKHKEALAQLLALADKHAKADGAPEVFRLFALAHLSALGDKAAEAAGKLGFAKEGDRWGKRDQLALYTIAKGFAKPGYIPAEAEKAAKGSAAFGPRYVAALLEIQKTISANSGFEALYKSLPSVAGAGTPKAADHMKSLAESLKTAAGCVNCKDGKVACHVCQGKKRTDVTCPLCKGLGWSQKNEKANVLVKCLNCKGLCVFKDAGCPNCKQTGSVECIISAGKGWRDNFKGCRECRICDKCHGKRQIETPCATCMGKGRVPPIVLGIPSILCDGCKGAALLKGPCKDCSETGIADCGKCGGKGVRDGKSPERPQLQDVYTASPCTACGGGGWPLPSLAVPCEKCFGLGVRVKPSADASKVLE